MDVSIRESRVRVRYLILFVAVALLPLIGAAIVSGTTSEKRNTLAIVALYAVFLLGCIIIAWRAPGTFAARIAEITGHSATSSPSWSPASWSAVQTPAWLHWC